MVTTTSPDKCGSKSKSTASRRADGCQSCRVGRVKCDKKKPSCGLCVKNNVECSYSRIQFNTINKRTHDTRTGRKTKGTMKQESPREMLPPVHLPQKTLKIVRVDPAASPSPAAKEAQLPTPVSSPTVSEASTSYRLSDIHKLLWPSNTVSSPQSGILSLPTSRCSSTIPEDSPSQSVCSTSVPPSPREDETQEDQISPTWSSFAGDFRDEVQFCIEEPSWTESIDGTVALSVESPPLSAPRAGFATFTAFSNPEIMAILRYSNARLLLHHYLQRSIATLHPQLGCSSDNTSATVFLPYCLAIPVALEAILAFSASQLAVVDPRQAQAVLYHKMASIKHLHRLVHQQALPGSSNASADNFSLDLVVSVLSQISVSVSESGTDTWQMHCKAAYSMLSCMCKPEAWECSRNLEAYLYCRLLKYICFAEIAKPTARVLDLSLIQGSNLTVEFGVPSSGLKLAVMISKYTHMRQVGVAGEALETFGQEVTECLREYVSMESFDDVASLSESHLMEAIWRSTVWLYYYRCVYETTADHDTSFIALPRIINYLKLIPLGSLYGTALAFPIQTIAPLITHENCDLRIWLLNYCRELARSTNTRNFIKIAEFSKIVWASMDCGGCSTMTAIRTLAEETGYVILAA